MERIQQKKYINQFTNTENKDTKGEFGSLLLYRVKDKYTLMACVVGSIIEKTILENTYDIPNIHYICNFITDLKKPRAPQQTQESQIKIGPCTLIVSLTIKQLLLNYKIIELLNAGGVAGCKCYLNSASANKMLSFYDDNDDETKPQIMDITKNKIFTKCEHDFPNNVEYNTAYDVKLLFIENKLAEILIKKQSDKIILP